MFPGRCISLVLHNSGYSLSHWYQGQRAPLPQWKCALQCQATRSSSFGFGGLSWLVLAVLQKKQNGQRGKAASAGPALAAAASWLVGSPGNEHSGRPSHRSLSRWGLHLGCRPENRRSAPVWAGKAFPAGVYGNGNS